MEERVEMLETDPPAMEEPGRRLVVLKGYDQAEHGPVLENDVIDKHRNEQRVQASVQQPVLLDFRRKRKILSGTACTLLRVLETHAFLLPLNASIIETVSPSCKLPVSKLTCHFLPCPRQGKENASKVSKIRKQKRCFTFLQEITCSSPGKEWQVEAKLPV